MCLGFSPLHNVQSTSTLYIFIISSAVSCQYAKIKGQTQETFKRSYNLITLSLVFLLKSCLTLMHILESYALKTHRNIEENKRMHKFFPQMCQTEICFMLEPNDTSQTDWSDTRSGEALAVLVRMREVVSPLPLMLTLASTR